MPDEPNMMDIVNAGNCESLYFNGFSIAVGVGDVVICLQLNGKPHTVLNASYTVAKTLGESLRMVIAELEGKTGTEIMTTEKVAESISRGAT